MGAMPSARDTSTSGMARARGTSVGFSSPPRGIEWTNKCVSHARTRWARFRHCGSQCNDCVESTGHFDIIRIYISEMEGGVLTCLISSRHCLPAAWRFRVSLLSSSPKVRTSEAAKSFLSQRSYGPRSGGGGFAGKKPVSRLISKSFFQLDVP
jgi:hypothetical protein